MVQRRRRTSGPPGNGFGDRHRGAVERLGTGLLLVGADERQATLGQPRIWNRSVELSAKTKIYREGVLNVPIRHLRRIWVFGPYFLVGRTE
jgi:hypothetical protein